MRKNTIQIKDLSIGYTGKNKQHFVAKHIDATIYSGQLTCLLGANGVGKSTLLRTLSGFQSKLGGTIELLAKEITSYSHSELANVLSVVLTDKPDIYNMTVEEMVGLGRCPYTNFWGSLSATDQIIINDSMQLVNIMPIAGRTIQTLSDGERQKTMIAKALAQDTPIIFLDEPTAFLDFPSKVEVMQLLHRLSREMGKTIFLSTHDVELALQIADNIWLMEKEQGITVGAPEELALDGTLQRFFGYKGIFFDENLGLFRVDNECADVISLTGEGVRYNMARKALIRVGIGVSAQGSSSVSVRVDDDCYLVTSVNCPCTKASSIDGLIDGVRKHLTHK